MDCEDDERADIQRRIDKCIATLAGLGSGNRDVLYHEIRRLQARLEMLGDDEKDASPSGKEGR